MIFGNIFCQHFLTEIFDNFRFNERLIAAVFGSMSVLSASCLLVEKVDLFSAVWRAS